MGFVVGTGSRGIFNGRKNKFATTDNDHRTALRTDKVQPRDHSLLRAHRQNAAATSYGGWTPSLPGTTPKAAPVRFVL